MRESTLVLKNLVNHFCASQCWLGRHFLTICRLYNKSLFWSSVHISYLTLLCTSFFKPCNDEMAFQVRVAPQIKCSVTLVSFFCWNIWFCLVHDKKEKVENMQKFSPPSALVAFSLLRCCFKELSTTILKRKFQDMQTHQALLACAWPQGILSDMSF